MPVLSESTREQLLASIINDVKDWKKWMIHHLKDENPEVNTLLLGLAQDSQDPKMVILAGYAVYRALELAYEQEAKAGLMEFALDEESGDAPAD